MKRSIAILLITIAASLQLHAQDSISAQSVTMERHLLNRFYIDSVRVGMNTLIAGCGANEPAADMFGKAQESKFFGTVFCLVGGALITAPLISCIWDDSPNWPMLVAGVCMATISVPIFVNYNKQSAEALRLMGEEYTPPKTDQPDVSLNIGLMPNGIGLCVRF